MSQRIFRDVQLLSLHPQVREDRCYRDRLPEHRSRLYSPKSRLWPGVHWAVFPFPSSLLFLPSSWGVDFYRPLPNLHQTEIFRRTGAEWSEPLSILKETWDEDKELYRKPTSNVLMNVILCHHRVMFIFRSQTQMRSVYSKKTQKNSPCCSNTYGGDCVWQVKHHIPWLLFILNIPYMFSISIVCLHKWIIINHTTCCHLKEGSWIKVPSSRHLQDFFNVTVTSDLFIRDLKKKKKAVLWQRLSRVLKAILVKRCTLKESFN